MGLLVSVVLLYLRILPRSFADGMPMLEIEREKMAGDPKTVPGQAEEIFTPRRIARRCGKRCCFSCRRWRERFSGCC